MKHTFLLCLFFFCMTAVFAQKVETEQYNIPVLTHKATNHLIRVRIIKTDDNPSILKSLNFSFKGTSDIKEIESVAFYAEKNEHELDPEQKWAETSKVRPETALPSNLILDKDTVIGWISIKLSDQTDLSHRITANLISATFSTQKRAVKPTCLSLSSLNTHRIGVAVRQHGQDGICGSRIPGLITTKNGTLIAVFSMRKYSYIDLPNDVDVGITRSFDKGKTWQPVQKIIDMGTYGGLPEKYNGVDDPSILVDRLTGDIFVLGIWQHGVIDPDSGQWVEGLTESSEVWNNPWNPNGSKPGYEPNQTSQVVMVKSSDDGATWSEPQNITRQLKKEDWCLFSPCPGRGITLDDGTLVFPIQGKENDGTPFSTIAWSKDHGQTWHDGNAAFHNTLECSVVQLSDGSLMLIMREKGNRGRHADCHNGRVVAVSNDLGQTWTSHPTSFSALIEPTCMASLYKPEKQNNTKPILLFFNPNSTLYRHNHTLKVSFDDGDTWPSIFWKNLDEWIGNGYSCITTVDDHTIGILFEGSQADLQYMQLSMDEILTPEYRTMGTLRVK